MIPLRDDVHSKSVPFVTIGLISLSVPVLLYQAAIGVGGDPRVAEAASIITARASAVGGEMTGGTVWFAHIGGSWRRSCCCF
jgi:hypothetical protein